MKRSIKRMCQRHLRDTFGLPQFRPGQKAAAYALLSGWDLLCVLPTGAGKSLCWQLPAVVHGGLTVVVSPLIALMRDQVAHLARQGVKAVTLNSLMSPEDYAASLSALQDGAADILLLSPERLRNPALAALFADRPPWMVVVDEAHCIVQWGGEFRPAYAAIGEFIHTLPRRPVICAMTATADRNMQRAIAESLMLTRHKRVTLPMVRPNLIYEVCTTLDRTGDILHLCREEPVRTVVFCRSRARAEKLAALLKHQGSQADYYHAGRSREEREAIERRYMAGEIVILAATSAFGMGIDIPDVRRVIHDYLPETLIDYVQQAGRAGRDGQDASCILLLEPMDLVKCGGALRRGLKRLKLHPLRRLTLLRTDWLPVCQMLRVMMTAPCIPAAVARGFGSGSRPCGRCSACRRGPLARRVPQLPFMSEQETIVYFLRWQRDALARQLHLPRRKVLTVQQLHQAARCFSLPGEAGAHARPIARLLDYFHRGIMHHRQP